MLQTEGRICLSTTMQPPSLWFPLYRPVVAMLPLPASLKDKDAQDDRLGVLLLLAISGPGAEILVNDDPHQAL